MYPHDGRVDHLDGGIMSDSKRVESEGGRDGAVLC